MGSDCGRLLRSIRLAVNRDVMRGPLQQPAMSEAPFSIRLHNGSFVRVESAAITKSRETASCGRERIVG